jgi:hypothetical protein
MVNDSELFPSKSVSPSLTWEDTTGVPCGPYTGQGVVDTSSLTPPVWS